MSFDIAKGLDLAAAAVKALPIDEKAKLVAEHLLHFGAVMLRRGDDPVAHLSRILDINPGFDAASKAADADAARKFAGEEK